MGRDEDASLVKDSRFSPAKVLAPKAKADLAKRDALSVMPQCVRTAAFAWAKGTEPGKGMKGYTKMASGEQLVDAVTEFRPMAIIYRYDASVYACYTKGRRENNHSLFDALPQTRDKRPSYILIREVTHIYNERRKCPTMLAL
jgi:hypothetical protein